MSRTQTPRTAIIDGFVGAIWGQGTRPLAAFEFRVTHGKIVGIEVVWDPSGSAN